MSGGHEGAVGEGQVSHTWVLSPSGDHEGLVQAEGMGHRKVMTEPGRGWQEVLGVQVGLGRAVAWEQWRSSSVSAKMPSGIYPQRSQSCISPTFSPSWRRHLYRPGQRQPSWMMG